MVQLSIKNLKKDTPATYAFAGTLFTAWGSTIAGYGLTASNAVVGFIGLGCALIGVTLTIFSNKITYTLVIPISSNSISSLIQNIPVEDLVAFISQYKEEEKAD